MTGEAGLLGGTPSVAHDVWEAFGKGTPGYGRSESGLRPHFVSWVLITGEAGLPRGTPSVAHDVWEAFGKGTPGYGRSESGLWPHFVRWVVDHGGGRPPPWNPLRGTTMSGRRLVRARPVTAGWNPACG